MSAPMVLRTAIGRYHHVQALRDGTVRSARLSFEMVEVEPIIHAFRRMVRELTFDVCEIALATHAQAHAVGKPITALPIVLRGGFHHGAIVCRRDAAIDGPADLPGRRIGVRAYSQTTGVWVRGILSSEYGVDPHGVTWVTTEDAHVAEYRDPPNVVRAAAGRTLRQLLLAGEIDAAVGIGDVEPNEVRTVIPDADAVAAAWFRKSGIYPVNHVLAVKSDLLAREPWLAGELFALFTAARERAAAAIGDDGFARHGMAANHASIEMLLRFAAEQGLTAHRYRAADLFAAALMNTT